MCYSDPNINVCILGLGCCQNGCGVLGRGLNRHSTFFLGETLGMRGGGMGGGWRSLNMAL